MADQNERDEARDFGNEQSMSVHDKTHPALGPTEEAQDVATLQQAVVPMPAFNDPNNPVAASGSVNLSLNDHPVQHAEDYGQAVIETVGHDHIEHTMSEGANTLKEYDLSQSSDEARAARAFADLPAERGEWTKANWQSAAKSYDLAVSGNIDTIRERVEAHEAELSKTPEDRRAEEVEAASTFSASDWKAQVEDAQDANALDELQSLYNESGAEYTTVDSAFESKRAEFSEQA